MFYINVQQKRTEIKIMYTFNCYIIGLFWNTANQIILEWQNFRLVQIQSIYRQQNNSDSKIEIVFGRVENILGKAKIVGYQYFLLFPQCFKGFLFRMC